MQNQDEEKPLEDKEQKTNMSRAALETSVILPLVLYQTIIAEYLGLNGLMQLDFVFEEMGFHNIFPNTFWKKRVEQRYRLLLETLPERQDEESKQISKIIQAGKYREVYIALHLKRIEAADIQKRNILEGFRKEQTIEQLNYLKNFVNSITSLNFHRRRIKDFGVQRLAKVIEENQTLTFLNLGENQIGDESVQSLAAVLEKNRMLQSLFLYHNQINVCGAEYLAKSLIENSTLILLNLNNNQIGDFGAQCLSKALIQNQTLAHLYLQSNQIGDFGVKCLAKVLEQNQSLISLALGYNEIGRFDGVEYLAQALKKNQTLVSLNLESNQIGDTQAKQLAEMLQKNQTLMMFYLGGNRINNTGAQYLAAALEKNKTLTFFSLFNNHAIGLFGAQCLIKSLEQNKALTSFYFYGNRAAMTEDKKRSELICRNIELCNRCIQSLKNREIQKIQEFLCLGVSCNGVLIKLASDNDNCLISIQLLFQIAQDKISRGAVLESIEYAKDKMHLPVVNFLQFQPHNILKENTEQADVIKKKDTFQQPTQVCCLV